MKQQRRSGVDLVRCMAFLLACSIHFFMYNGFYDLPQKGLVMLLGNSARWFAFSAIGLFLMLTGFFKCNDTDLRSCYRGLVRVVVAYVLATLISIPVRHFLLGEPHSLSQWITLTGRFLAVRYGWYVKMYIGLALLMPFINRLLAQLKSKKALLTLAAALLVITALPGATPYSIAPSYWMECYPLTFYVLGAVVRRLEWKLRPWQGIGISLVLALLCGTLTVTSGNGNLESCSFSFRYGDLWILGIAVSLFLSFYHLQLPKALGKVLAFCAGGTYCGYLLCNLLDTFAYNLLPQWHSPKWYPLLYLCATVPIFLCSVLLGKALQTATDKLITCCKGKKRPM